VRSLITHRNMITCQHPWSASLQGFAIARSCSTPKTKNTLDGTATEASMVRNLARGKRKRELTYKLFLCRRDISIVRHNS
jgi:outer membrane protein assembly factor BamE (lipoprotein component of BamABCDE complex)